MRNATHGKTPHHLHSVAGPDGRHALRAELHRAADPDRIAEHRTADAVAELRAKAAWFRDAMELYSCQPLGYWYAELATRFGQMADDIESTATANGIMGAA